MYVFFVVLLWKKVHCVKGFGEEKVCVITHLFWNRRAIICSHINFYTAKLAFSTSVTQVSQ